MSSVSGFRGVYAVDWAQTAAGEEWGLAPHLMSIGMTWRWRGPAWRLDPGGPTLWLEPLHAAPAADRQRVRARARRLARAPETSAVAADAEGLTPGRDVFALTDGRRRYGARIVRVGQRLIAVFDPLMPPPDRDFWISELLLGSAASGRRAGVICFLPGTRIATPAGPRPVEALQPGDLVLTRDNGAQPLVWRGETRLSGAELYLHPQLRPVRIRAGSLPGGGPDGDLLVSPGHRLLCHAGEGEVLVAAADLEDGRRVRRDFSLTSVRYVHLMLEQHQILTANGIACESFHPGLADPQVLAWHARSLEQALPGASRDPGRYGPTARRCLDGGEARILGAQPA